MHQLKKTVTALVLVIAMVFSMVTVALADENGTVTGDCVRIRTKPSLDSEAYQQTNTGDQLRVLEPADENGWVKVAFTYAETGEEKVGYISSDYIDVPEQEDAETSQNAQDAQENQEETQVVRAPSAPASEQETPQNGQQPQQAASEKKNASQAQDKASAQTDPADQAPAQTDPADSSTPAQAAPADSSAPAKEQKKEQPAKDASDSEQKQENPSEQQPEKPAGDSNEKSDQAAEKPENGDASAQEQPADEQNDQSADADAETPAASENNAAENNESEKNESENNDSSEQEQPAEQPQETPDEEQPSDQEPAEEGEEIREDGVADIASSISYTATITDEGVRIRKKPSTKADVLLSLSEGDIVTVLSPENDEGWMKVSYQSDEKYTGYISGEYLDINMIGSGLSCVVNAIIREEADNSAAINGLIPLHKRVDIYASKDNWYQVEYQDIKGWVHSDCIKTEGDSDCIGYGVSKTDGLHLREKTSRKSDSLTKLPENATFQISSKTKDGEWYAITYNGLSGYVASEYVDVSEHCNGGYVQVTASSLSLRSGAGSDYARLTTIPQGKVLKVEGSVGSWYQVSYDSFSGYVSGSFVSPTGKDGFQGYPDYAEITASSLTLRSEPTTDSSALDSIPEGAVLAITGIRDGWYEVSYNGQTGYIDSGYAERSTAAAAEAAAAAQSGEEPTTSGGGGGSVLSYASQFVGNPYVWGGTSLTGGADCSGFVKSIFAHFGISLPHSSAAIRGYGQSVSYSDMRPGDVVCYSGHVGIYAGNGQLLSALGKKYGITYNDVNYKHIITIRRMV